MQFFFDDYHFPSELYNKETGDFTAPIRTLLDFAPHILQQLPKEEKVSEYLKLHRKTFIKYDIVKIQDQKPIHSETQDSWTKSFLSNTTNSYFGSLLTSERTKAITEFVIRCGNEYLKSTSEKRRGEEEFKRFKAEDRRRRRRENEKRWFFEREQVSSSSEDEEEEIRERANKKFKKEAEDLKQKKKEKEDDSEKLKENQQLTSIADNSTLVKSAVAASVLSLSLYSTYQASVAFSDISFHNQLALLVTQVQSIIQSTEVWIEEHEKMDDKVPNRVRSDLTYIKQLIEDIVRLDPRANKKVEAAGWGCGAVGGLSALGGMALGSAAVATGGAALALGGVIVMISAKAQSAGKSNLGARILLENKVRENVRTCEQKSKERERIIAEAFTTSPKVEKVEEKPPVKIGSKRYIL